MTSAEHFADINDRLVNALKLYRQLNGPNALPDLNENRPFVGINFVATGDFNQIKPVNATSLASAMIQHCISENMETSKIPPQSIKPIQNLFKSI